MRNIININYYYYKNPVSMCMFYVYVYHTALLSGQHANLSEMLDASLCCVQADLQWAFIQVYGLQTYKRPEQGYSHP